MRKLLFLFLAAHVFAAELPPLPAGAFTVVVIPDSQGYLGHGTKIEPKSTNPVTNPWLENHVKFIREHRDDQNIVFVTHVGDIVEKDREAEWAIAKQHLDLLRGVVPFSLTVGNHDMSSKGDAHLFQQAFLASSFKKRTPGVSAATLTAAPTKTSPRTT